MPRTPDPVVPPSASPSADAQGLVTRLQRATAALETLDLLARQRQEEAAQQAVIDQAAADRRGADPVAEAEAEAEVIRTAEALAGAFDALDLVLLPADDVQIEATPAPPPSFAQRLRARFGRPAAPAPAPAARPLRVLAMAAIGRPAESDTDWDPQVETQPIVAVAFDAAGALYHVWGDEARVVGPSYVSRHPATPLEPGAPLLAPRRTTRRLEPCDVESLYMGTTTRLGRLTAVPAHLVALPPTVGLTTPVLLEAARLATARLSETVARTEATVARRQR